MNSKQIIKICREQAKINNWKFKRFFAYKKVNEFIFVIFFFNGKSSKSKKNYLQLNLQFKPLLIDEIFWEIAEIEENYKKPLSFRADGVFTFRPKDLYTIDLEFSEEDELSCFLKKQLIKCENSVELISKEVVTLNDYLDYIKNNPNNDKKWKDIDLQIGTNILLKKYDKALQLCAHAKIHRKMGGWSFSKGSFYDLAIKHIEKTGYNNIYSS